MLLLFICVNLQVPWLQQRRVAPNTARVQKSASTRRGEARMVAAEEIQIDDRVKAVMEAEAAAKAQEGGNRQGRSLRTLYWCEEGAMGRQYIYDADAALPHLQAYNFYLQ